MGGHMSAHSPTNGDKRINRDNPIYTMLVVGLTFKVWQQYSKKVIQKMNAAHQNGIEYHSSDSEGSEDSVHVPKDTLGEEDMLFIIDDYGQGNNQYEEDDVIEEGKNEDEQDEAIEDPAYFDQEEEAKENEAGYKSKENRRQDDLHPNEKHEAELRRLESIKIQVQEDERIKKETHLGFNHIQQQKKSSRNPSYGSLD